MIKLFDLKRQRTLISDSLDQRIATVLNKAQFILGDEVSELEDALTAYTGAKFCITCGNGTDAIQIALMSLNIGTGDDVIVPAFSYFSTAEAVAITGATPIYVDIALDDCLIDTRKIEEKLTPNTKAIIFASLFGTTPNIKELKIIAEKYGLKLIEDAAQSFGANYGQAKSCNLSDIGCTSFFPTKPLGCYGDGGAIFTSSRTLADKIRRLARHGQTQKYLHEDVGMNSRLDTLQATILLEKLKLLDTEILRRQQNAGIYHDRLKHISSIRLPTSQGLAEHTYSLFTILAKDRDNLKNYLSDKGIEAGVYYPRPLYKQPALHESGMSMQNSEFAADNALSLPVHPYLNTKEIDYVCDSLSLFYKNI